MRHAIMMARAAAINATLLRISITACSKSQAIVATTRAASRNFSSLKRDAILTPQLRSRFMSFI